MDLRHNSRKNAILGFVIAVAGAVFAALDLHGWHAYAMLAVTAVVAIVAGIQLARKIHEAASASADNADAVKSRGE